MSLFDYFQDQTVSVTPIVITQAPDGSGNWVDTETPGTAFGGIVYNRSAASRYFSQSWAEDVSAVLVCKSIGALSNSDKVEADSVTYAIDSIEDPGKNNASGWDNVYLIGLRAIV